MTEAQWMENRDALPMLEFLHRKSSERKLLLYGAACCRRAWHLFHDKRSRNAVEVVEHFANGEAGQSERAAAYEAALLRDRHPFMQGEAAIKWAAQAAFNLAGPPNTIFSLAAWIHNNVAGPMCHAVVASLSDRFARGDHYYHREREAHCHLVRHLIGNPFHAYATPNHWSPSVVQLAQAMYEREDCWFALHDSLADAGHEELANHFQEGGWHPKGCWVVDLILGKS